MIKLVFVAILLSLLSSAAGACIANVMNMTKGIGTPVEATSSTLAEVTTQPGHAAAPAPETRAPQGGPAGGTAEQTGAEPEATGYVRELLEALEREYEQRIDAERRLAREEARQARRNAPPPVTYRTPPVPQPAPRVRRAALPTTVPVPAATAPVVPAPRPVQAPEQKPATGVIAAGTSIRASVDATISSDRAQPGDRVTATVQGTISDNGRTLLRNGDQLVGTVTAVDNSGRMSGSAALTVAFHAVLIDGSQVQVETDAVTRTGPGQGRQNGTRIGGGAAVGAILGGIFGGKEGAALGGAIGAAGGTAAAAAQRAAPATLEAGEAIVLRTTRATTVPAR